jgi:hypothetical protein
VNAPGQPLPRTRRQWIVEFLLLWFASTVISAGVYTRTLTLGGMVLAGGLGLLGAALIARPSRDRGRFVRAVAAALLGVFTPIAVLFLFLLATCPDSGCLR